MVKNIRAMCTGQHTAHVFIFSLTSTFRTLPIDSSTPSLVTPVALLFSYNACSADTISFCGGYAKMHVTTWEIV